MDDNKLLHALDAIKQIVEELTTKPAPIQILELERDPERAIYIPVSGAVRDIREKSVRLLIPNSTERGTEKVGDTVEYRDGVWWYLWWLPLSSIQPEGKDGLVVGSYVRLRIELQFLRDTKIDDAWNGANRTGKSFFEIHPDLKPKD